MICPNCGHVAVRNGACVATGEISRINRLSRTAEVTIK